MKKIALVAALLLGAACGDSELTKLPLQSAVTSGAVMFSDGHWLALQSGAQIWLTISGPEGAELDAVVLQQTKVRTSEPSRISVGLQTWRSSWSSARLTLDEPLAVDGPAKPLLSWSGVAGDRLFGVSVQLSDRRE